MLFKTFFSGRGWGIGEVGKDKLSALRWIRSEEPTYNVVTVVDKMCYMTEVCWEDGTEMVSPKTKKEREGGKIDKWNDVCVN